MTDGALIQIVDAALAEAARRAGPWLVCRPGCAECCIGPFEITSLDARRLREGLAAIDPAVAARVLDRARAYPADSDAFDETPCPALDPDTRTCDLYAWRPITCRTFGPPVRFGAESLAICELCFEGATPEQIKSCEIEVDPHHLEAELLNGDYSETIVAHALLCSDS
jgi:Fe-S-cluster containining protein